MRQLEWIDSSKESKHRVLLWSAGVAFVLEAIIVTATGWEEHWLSHPPKPGQDENRFIEAQIYQAPQERPHLVEEKKTASPPAQKEAAISVKPGSGKANPSPTPFDAENKTESGPKSMPNHGPVVVFSPAPVIPSYLQDKNLKTTVIIDFYISAQGVTTPRLVGSSGNEELDAIALGAAKRWQFRPAEKDHKAIDSKTRLRINFEVE